MNNNNNPPFFTFSFSFSFSFFFSSFFAFVQRTRGEKTLLMHLRASTASPKPRGGGESCGGVLGTSSVTASAGGDGGASVETSSAGGGGGVRGGVVVGRAGDPMGVCPGPSSWNGNVVRSLSSASTSSCTGLESSRASGDDSFRQKKNRKKETNKKKKKKKKEKERKRRARE